MNRSGARSVDLRTLEPRRVCIIKPSSLGDVVHALPVLTPLRERWPRSHIAWVIHRSLRELVEPHPFVDEAILFDRGRFRTSPAGVGQLARFARRLRQGEFDLTIDLQGLLRSGLMSLATSAPVRVGFADAREGAALCYTHRIEASQSHAVDRLLTIAAAFGADIASPRFVVAIDESDRRWAAEVLAAVPRPRLVLNMGARWLTKRWPVAHFAEVARRAFEEQGAGLVVVGAPDDTSLASEFQRRLDPAVPVLDLCGRTSLRQLAAVGEASDVFLSNDSGPLHLAAATGTRVVGVYTCTRPEWTGPYGSNAIVVRSQVWCAGSCVKACSRMECMTELGPERVWEAVRRAFESSMRTDSSAA